MKNIFTQQKLILWLTFNRGLALTGFRTTWPWNTKTAVTWSSETKSSESFNEVFRTCILTCELHKQVRRGCVGLDSENKWFIDMLTSHRNSTVLWVCLYHLTSLGQVVM